MVRPSRVRATDSSRSSSMDTPAALPRVDDRAVPVDAEPLDDGLGDGRADALGRGELLLGGAADRRHRPELLGQRPRGGRADVADRQRDQHPPQRHLLGAGRGCRAAAGRWPRAPGPRPRTSSAARVNSSVRQQLVLVEVEDVALVVDHLRVEQRDRRLVAEALDVEGAAAGDVEDPLAHLGRAELVVGAAEVLVALLLLRQRGAAGGALGRHHPLRQARRGAAAAPARRSRGSRRRPCAGSRCRRGGRPCA